MRASARWRSAPVGWPRRFTVSACDPGDRVGSYAWNTQQHLEAYYAVPCMGAVLHTLNLRLFPEQVAYTANHARDRVIILDASLVEQIEAGGAAASRPWSSSW